MKTNWISNPNGDSVKELNNNDVHKSSDDLVSASKEELRLILQIFEKKIAKGENLANMHNTSSSQLAEKLREIEMPQIATMVQKVRSDTEFEARFRRQKLIELSRATTNMFTDMRRKLNTDPQYVHSEKRKVDVAK